MITSAFRQALPQVLGPLLGLNKIEQVYAALGRMDSARPITERLLEHLEITYRVAERDLPHIPAKGAAVVVVNHPFGILEGAVLATVLKRIRPDVRFLANEILAGVPEIQDMLIPVDVLGGPKAARGNYRGLREAIEHLERGGLLAVFPAGEVSHFDWRARTVTDPAWSPMLTRLIEIASRRALHAKPLSVIPVYVKGANSALFQTLGMIHPRMRTALLARELLNKRRHCVELRIGSPIDSEKLRAIPAEERIAYLRWRTYLLANRSEFKAKTARPLAGNRARKTEPVTLSVDPKLIAAEVSRLGADALLAKSGSLDAYAATADNIPNTLAEIGRLREITFRDAGEGTGRAVDLDRFDAHYLHLFLWNRENREIAGAYRMAGSEAGAAGLYTSTLFGYGQEFLEKLGPALELGRSFIRADYQKGFLPLLLLWKGIGQYVARNPRYRVLFGAVSISSQYQSVSRELMAGFLERHASLRGWRDFLDLHCPFRASNSTGLEAAFPRSGFDVDDLSQVVSDLEPSRAGVPVLLRQYLRLGGKLLGFNVDPDFSNALDGLILVDLTRTEPKLLERYLGKSEAATFLNYQKGQNGTQ